MHVFGILSWTVFSPPVKYQDAKSSDDDFLMPDVSYAGNLHICFGDEW